MRHDLERGGWSRGERQQWAAALKQLDRAIADLHSAADEGNQKEAQSAVKKLKPLLINSNPKILPQRSKVCINLSLADRSQRRLKRIVGEKLAVFSVEKQIFVEEESLDVVRAGQIL